MISHQQAAGIIGSHFVEVKDVLLNTLFYLKENTIDDISQITGLSVSNVKVKLFRIRKKLYDELQSKMKIEAVV